MDDDSPLFDDLKPWPDQGPPPAHHNQPPLEDQVCLDFEEALRRLGLDQRAARIADSAARAPDITDRQTAGKVGDLIAAGRIVKAAIETERETLNRPLLNAQRALKARADDALGAMENNLGILRLRLDSFMATAEPVHGDHGARVGTRTDWLFEITDPAKLPLAIRRHPDVIAAMEKVVRAHVRGGARSIAGVRIWSVEKANVR